MGSSPRENEIDFATQQWAKGATRQEIEQSLVQRRVPPERAAEAYALAGSG